MTEMRFEYLRNDMGLLFFLILRICLSSSFTQYTVTITQVQESVSDFNPESESESHKKNEDSASLFKSYRTVLGCPLSSLTEFCQKMDIEAYTSQQQRVNMYIHV